MSAPVQTPSGLRGCALVIGLLLGAACSGPAPVDSEAELRELLALPSHFQVPAVPARNPLTKAKVALGLGNVSVHHARAEAFRDPAGFDCITSRAFAPLADILRVSAHLLAPGGCLLAMKGRLGADELVGVLTPYTVRSLIELRVPGIEVQRQLVRIERQEATVP